MHTGYIHQMLEKDMDFSQFVRYMLRGMDACIMHRNEPWDFEIPEVQEPSDYHEKKLAKAREDLSAFDALSITAAEKIVRQKIQEEIEHFEEYEKKTATELIKIQAMREKVLSWTPPTKGHKNFQKFMLDQLDQSLKNNNSYIEERIKELVGSLGDITSCVKKHRELLKWSVENHEKAMREEIMRCADRTVWIKAVIDTLE